MVGKTMASHLVASFRESVYGIRGFGLRRAAKKLRLKHRSTNAKMKLVQDITRSRTANCSILKRPPGAQNGSTLSRAARARLKLMMDCLRSATRIGESNTCASTSERSLRLMIGTRWRYGRRQSWSVFSAHGFTADWSLERVQRIPTADDIHAYVADYEEARGRPFSKLERQSLFAH